MPTIASLVANGRLERIEPDPQESRDLIRHANAHLESAAAIMERDPAGAYQLAYDAARKAVAADMSANGYRASADRQGSHAAVVAYAAEALAETASVLALQRFELMRRVRNRTEYGGFTVGRAQVIADLEQAMEIVRAVQVRLLPTAE
jgi:L-lactate utilization protein LutC